MLVVTSGRNVCSTFATPIALVARLFLDPSSQLNYALVIRHEISFLALYTAIISKLTSAIWIKPTCQTSSSACTSQDKLRNLVDAISDRLD
jgi:hypothetical protein